MPYAGNELPLIKYRKTFVGVKSAPSSAGKPALVYVPPKIVQVHYATSQSSEARPGRQAGLSMLLLVICLSNSLSWIVYGGGGQCPPCGERA